MKKALCVLLALLLFPAPALAQEGPLCVEVMGYRPMVVTYEVEDGKIASFEVVEHQEAPGHGAEVIAAGFDSLIGQDVQSARFDAVSGATRTSNGINGALRLAARGAGKPYPGAAPAPAVDLAAAQEAPPPPEAAAFPGDSFTFRDGISFGMSIEQVRALEPDVPVQLEHSLGYLGQQFAGLDAYIQYWFNDDALTEIYVFFEEVYADDALFFADFDEVEAAFTAAYGPASFSFADLPPYSMWYMDGYTIFHILLGNNGDRSHYIYFTSDAYDDEEDEAPKASPSPTAFPGASFSFRNGVSFGMTMEQVRALEPDDPLKRGNTLSYPSQQLAGLDAYIQYWFNDDALTEVYVFFEALYADDALYPANFSEVEAALTAKYGPAYLSEADDSDAPSSGLPEPYSVWFMDGYTIYHILSSYSGDLCHYIFFTSAAYDENVDESQETFPAPTVSLAPETAPAPGFSFRYGITFGMSMEQVRSLEPDDPIPSKDSLMYFDQQFAGCDMYAFYSFSANRLSDILIFFAEIHADDALYLADFDEAEAALTTKYGPASLSDADGSERSSMWFMDGCSISHELCGDSGDLCHIISFTTDAFDDE